MGMKAAFPENSVIIKEGRINPGMYIVTSGVVALYANYKKEDEYILGVLSKGKAFGEMGLLCHEKSPYTAVANTDVELVTFSEFELGSFIRSYPDQALGIMRSIARINKMLSLSCQLMSEDLNAVKAQNNINRSQLSRLSENNNNILPKATAEEEKTAENIVQAQLDSYINGWHSTH